MCVCVCVCVCVCMSWNKSNNYNNMHGATIKISVCYLPTKCNYQVYVDTPYFLSYILHHVSVLIETSLGRLL